MTKIARRKLIAYICWTTTLVIIVFALIFAVTGGAVKSDAVTPVFLLIQLTFATVGLLLVLKIPDNRMGWVFSSGGLLASLWAATQTYYEGAKMNGWPGIGYAAWLNFAVYLPMILCLVSLPLLLFPDGEVPSRGWRWVWWPIVTLAFLAVLTTTFTPEFTEEEAGVITYQVSNPIGVDVGGGIFGSGAFDVLGAVLVALGLLAPAAAMIYRFRRSRGVERLQLKWIAFSATLAGVGLALYYTVQLWTPVTSLWAQALVAVALIGVLGIPVTAGLAIAKYRLYDIDRLINRTISYGLLAGLLGGVYALGVFLLGSLAFSGGFQVALSTLAVAALFNPLRRRLHRTLDRRFSRSVYAHEEVIDGFAHKIRDVVDVDVLVRDLLGVVDTTVAPVRRAVWVRQQNPSV
jgi:hypothetical protein